MRKTRKFRTAIVSILTFATLVITCWQFYKSSPEYNLSGAWQLKFTVQSSSYKPYIGEYHTQQVAFCQNNCEINGDGEKREYNGKLLPFNMHRKIEYYGYHKWVRLQSKI